jgi:hypothetical protein
VSTNPAFSSAFAFGAFTVRASACDCDLTFDVQTGCVITFSAQTAGDDDMAETFDIGDLVRSRAAFTDTDTGSALDPTTVAAVLREPDGTETTYTYGSSAELARSAAGIYLLRFTPTDPGTHRVRWVTTGTGQCVEEGWCQIRPRLVS